MLREGPKTWKQLLTELSISAATLSSCLSELMKSGEVKTFNDSKDRRITWYEAVKEKIESEIIRNESLAFIESLEEPLTVLEKSKDGKLTVSVFMSPYPKGIENVIRVIAKSWLPISEKGLRIPKEGYKMAVVITKMR